MFLGKLLVLLLHRTYSNGIEQSMGRTGGKKKRSRLGAVKLLMLQMEGEREYHKQRADAKSQLW